MEKGYSFFATLEANVFLNDAEFYFISHCMKHHYDITVKMSVEIGGFMYGLMNRRTLCYRDITDEDRTCDFSNRELQLILKSLEMQQSDEAIEVKKRLRHILDEMSKKQNRVNEGLNI